MKNENILGKRIVYRFQHHRWFFANRSSCRVVANCTEADLRAAMMGGGNVVFACDGVITLTNPLFITNEVEIDANDHNIVLSGGNALRIFNVNAQGNLRLKSLNIANGHYQGENGAPGASGMTATGGAIQVEGGAVTFIGCQISGNSANGGAGGNGNVNGSGGAGFGGAVFLNNASLAATNTEFIGNSTTGGAGGTNSSNAATGEGGTSAGGAIYALSSFISLESCRFLSNHITGGRAPDSSFYGDSGASGNASGGALFVNGGMTSISNCSFLFNIGSSPQPAGPFGGSGGVVSGGSIFSAGGSVTVTGSEFRDNHVLGGDARRHLGKAGHARGGAICNFDVLQVSECLFANNLADGGNNGTPAGNGNGGAIYNGGYLRIERSAFAANSALAGVGYSGGAAAVVNGMAQGGAIFSTNKLVLNQSTLSSNVVKGAAGAIAFEPYPGTAAFGGGIYNSGSCTLTNDTFAGNSAAGGNFGFPASIPSPSTTGGNGFGGAIFNEGGTITSVHNSIAQNFATGGSGSPPGTGFGGGIANTNGTVTALNTIIANNSGSNYFGALIDAGNNLSSDQSCHFTAEDSLADSDPKLGPLDNYGGLSATLPLLSGSPAIDAADTVDFASTDQRNRIRPFGSAPDIGAFESSAPFVVRGKISGFTLNSEVAVTAASSQALTTNLGHYSVEDLAPGSISVTPSNTNYLFIPDARNVTVGPDQLNVDFKAYRWNALSLEDASTNWIHLIYAGANGQTYRLFASSNLSDWIPVSTNTIGPSRLFEITKPMDGRSLFYRVQNP